MKKYFLVLISILMISIIGFITFNFDKSAETIYIEDYTNIKLLNNKLAVFGDYKVSSIVDIEQGYLLNDFSINTQQIGKKIIEVLYQDLKKNYKKAFFEIVVVDEIKPIILGSNNLKILKGSEDLIEHKLFSADNYDSNPQREIIGNYDINRLGEYDLILKVTDSSNNTTSKSFLLQVIAKLPKTVNSNTSTKFESIVKIHKTNNTQIGLDVSSWQGNINFDLIKKNGVEFMMIRVGFQKGFAGELVLDSYFLNNIKKANELTIPVGVYFYSYATSKEEAINQANWVINQIKEYKIDLPIAFDWEIWHRFSSLKLSLNDINEIAKSFMNKIEESSYQSMNYSSKFYLENIWTLEKTTWLAHYTKQTSYQGKYLMWQLCNDGVILGIDSKVDINILYK